ncbi:MAG: cupin domain-containing protein [Chloroflexota bacterium]|nr:cupin domain-containing protein [Chloroflexota bacterium]
MTRATLATEGFAARQHAQPFLGVWQTSSLAPGGSFVHPQTIPAIGYVAEGAVRWTTPSGVIDLKAGEGPGLPQLPVTETNLGTTASVWYAFAIAETGLESTTLATMRRLAVGPRLPLPQPDGSYTIRLDLITLEGGGRTASESHGGAEMIFVLDGQIEIRRAGDSHDFRGPKEGTGVAPGAAVQVLNRTSTPARVLEFFYTPDALTFETMLTTSP